MEFLFHSLFFLVLFGMGHGPRNLVGDFFTNPEVVFRIGFECQRLKIQTPNKLIFGLCPKVT